MASRGFKVGEVCFLGEGRHRFPGPDHGDLPDTKASPRSCSAPIHTHPNLKSGEGAEPPQRLCSTRPSRSRPHFLPRETRLCLSFAIQRKLRESVGRTRLLEAASQSEAATQSEGREGSHRRMGYPEKLTSYWLKASGLQPIRVGFLARGTGKLRLEFLEPASGVAA